MLGGGLQLALMPAPLIVAAIIVFGLSPRRALAARIVAAVGGVASIALLAVETASLGAGGRVEASLGTPGSGWSFVVVLTGQDGFSADQARSFASTPQQFQFGVCAAASADPHCTVDPGTVPKAIDVLTPQGVSQSHELDYVSGPVVLQGVTIP